ncbi:MAG: glycogen synthase GlgA [Pirellulales bacterium]
MKIVLATSEAVPFAKTGGLADVCGALPLELARMGHQVTMIMPAYREVRQGGHALEDTGVNLLIPIGQKTVAGRLLMGRLSAADTGAPDVPVYFVEQDDYFDRDGLYQNPDKGEDYRDNCERFVFFSRAVLEAIRLLELEVDVVHCNDWETGLVPALLQIEYRSLPRFENTVSLLTVHNLAYQGTFWHWDMLLTGLDWKYFNWHQMEFFGNLNLLKTGLVFADVINTVSPRYAEEIQSAPLGCGLEGVLQNRRKDLYGILNGVDYRQWNPETDPHLAQKYGPRNFEAGKAANKAALQQELGLPREPTTPLLAFVGRLAEQKGIDLLTPVIQEWANHQNAQWVILGTGDAKYQEAIATLAERSPHRVAARFAFCESLAHRIEAAADMFLMPSRFEPCGLNQMYSLKYGAVPVVRATGGLSDTITDATAETLAGGTANGFSFREYSSLALSETLSRACNTFARPDVWRKIITVGMDQDWSWRRSAQEYAALYQRLKAARRPAVTSA